MTEAHALSEDEDIALPERRANRPVTAAHRLEFGAMQALMGFFRLIGLDASSALAGKFLRLFGPLIRPMAKRAENNLAFIFPDWTDRQRRAVLKDVCENLGRTAAEFAHFDKFDIGRAGARIELAGRENLQAVMSSGRPVIFISGHFANWEIMPLSFQALGVDHAFVYRPANNPLTDEFIIHYRAKFMSRRQIPKGKRGGRALIENLKSGRSLLIMVDQKLNSGISVPFMGHPAMTAPAAARLSLKYGAPLVPISLERLNGAHFRFTAHEPIGISPSGEASGDIYALMKKINEWLETDIRARPGQWLWFHRRWPKQT